MTSSTFVCSSILVWGWDADKKQLTWTISILRTADHAYASKYFNDLQWNMIDPTASILELIDRKSGQTFRRFRTPFVEYDFNTSKVLTDQ